jgi:hypothetical protein
MGGLREKNNSHHFRNKVNIEGPEVKNMATSCDLSNSLLFLVNIFRRF